MTRILASLFIIISWVALASVECLTACSHGQGRTSTTPASYEVKDQVWVRAVAPGKGAWPEACGPGKWPRTLVPIEAFGKLWMIGLGKGSNSVWHSTDGVTWNKEKSNAGWGERYGPTHVLFKNKIWTMGGSQITNANLKNDVWYSDDGKNWTLATPKAGWAARRWHTALVFDNKIWIMGGIDDWNGDGQNPHQLNDVWSSSDGVEWTRVTEHAPWPPRWRHVSLVFDNKMWVIGGRDRNDVWSTTDGKNWKQVTAKAEWPSRMGQGGFAFDGKMWIFGGIEDKYWLNDIWYSTDGSHWTLATQKAPWSPRSADYSTVFNDKMWIFGGKADDGGTDDIWYMSPKRYSASR